MGAAEDADTLETPDGVTIAASEGDTPLSPFTIEVDNIEALMTFTSDALMGVDIVPFADGADDMGIEGTLEFYPVEDSGTDPAATA